MSRWTFLLDVSGPPTSSGPEHLMQWTVAGVALNTDLEKRVVQRLSRVRSKWIGSSKEEAEVVWDIIRDSAVCSQVMHMAKTAEDWGRYVEDGNRFVRELEANSRSIGKRHFRGETRAFRPEVMVKHFSFLVCASTLQGQAMRADPPKKPKHCLRKVMNIKAIIDNDIQGKENQRIHRDLWANWEPQSIFRRDYKIEVDVAFDNENDQPLLLLPDYLAGCIRNFVFPLETKRPDDFDRSDVEEMAVRLAASGNVHIAKYRFDGTYPLVIVDGNVKTQYSKELPQNIYYDPNALG